MGDGRWMGPMGSGERVGEDEEKERNKRNTVREIDRERENGVKVKG